MKKLGPLSYERYRKAIIRRLVPELVTLEKNTDTLATRVRKTATNQRELVERVDRETTRLSTRVRKTATNQRELVERVEAESIQTNIVTFPKRIEHPLALKPRTTPFGEPELRAVLGELMNFWFFEDEQANKIRYIVQENDSYSLLNSCLALAYDEGFVVSVLDAATKKVLAINVKAANDHFSTKKKVILLFTDQRDNTSPFSVQLESWVSTPEGHLSSPENNSTVSRIWAGTLASLEPKTGAADLHSVIPSPTDDEVDFEIDWVFTWVNGEDPKWQELFKPYAPKTITDAADRSRFETRDDLKYALRSLQENAPWIRKIHVLTNCEAPSWLDTTQDGIAWVDHSEVFEEKLLPTFSSHSIETVLHKIPNLTEHFVYSNDDFFLVRPAKKNDFFWGNGIARLRLEPYGMVNGEATEGEPDYLNAARNCANLLSRDLGQYPVRLHTHSPQSMNRVVLQELEEKYSEDFIRTRGNKFRHKTDIAVTGFMYHHYAFMTGRAVPDGGRTRLIQQNHKFEALFDAMIKEKQAGQVSKFLSVCVNDGRGSSDNPRWGSSALNFVNTFFPTKSKFEK